MRPRTFIDGLVTPPRKQEPGIPCPCCGTIIPEKEIASYAARRAAAAADPRNYKPGPGRSPTIPHKPRDPRCGCVDCRKVRRAAAIARREAKQAGARLIEEFVESRALPPRQMTRRAVKGKAKK